MPPPTSLDRFPGDELGDVRHRPAGRLQQHPVLDEGRHHIHTPILSLSARHAPTIRRWTPTCSPQHSSLRGSSSSGASLPGAARARRGAARDAGVGHLRHRQAHVPRRDAAVRRHRPRLVDAVPDHPGPRERRHRRRDRRRRRHVVRRHAAARRRPCRAGTEPGLRRMRVLPRRLPVLLLPPSRELRQLADLRRGAAPVRRMGRVPLPASRHTGVQGSRRAADERRRAHRTVRGDPQPRPGGARCRGLAASGRATPSPSSASARSASSTSPRPACSARRG